MLLLAGTGRQLGKLIHFVDLSESSKHGIQLATHAKLTVLTAALHLHIK